MSLPRLPAAMTSLLLTIQPVGAVGLAALIFGESPSALQLAGVALVLAGLLTATAPQRVKDYAIAGAFGRRSSAARMSSSENSKSSSLPARKAS